MGLSVFSSRERLRRALELAGGQPGENGVGFLQEGICKTAPWSAQEEEEFAGPEKNVQQAAALEIIHVIAVQGDVQGPPRAFLDKGPQGRQIQRHSPKLLGTWIDSLQVFIAKFYEVVQAKILLSQ